MGLPTKAHSPFPDTFTIGLANGYNGYLPTPDQHQLGSYTTWPAVSSWLETDAEPKIRKAVMELLKSTEQEFNGTGHTGHA